MLNVNNKNVIKKISIRTYQSNLKRNLMTIVAIVLTTVLIISILSIGMGYWNAIQDRSIKLEGMDYDFELSEPTQKQVEIARNMDVVQYAGVSVKCAILETAADRTLPTVRLFWTDKTCWDKQCLPAFESISGTYPKNENDIILSKSALSDMGIENPKMGMKINVTYTPLTNTDQVSEPLKYEFSLCGFFQDYSGASRGFVSEKFYKMTGVKQTDFTQGSLKITLKNPLYSEDTIMSMQKQFQLSDEQMMMVDYDVIPNFIKTLAVLTGLLFMIFASGYLFIFNTLYISVAKDIRYYGQLKTLGMTSKQLRKIIYTQSIWNSLIGIPIGVFAGIGISYQIVPMALRAVDTTIVDVAVYRLQPMLLCVAVSFSILTVFIGGRKPARIAGECSPIEATRYTTTSKRVKKKSSKNGLRYMASRNMFRDKKQAFVILCSFSICFIIYLVIGVIIEENGTRKIVDQLYSYDLQIKNETTLDEKKQLITENEISQIQKCGGVKDVRTVYSTEITVPYQEDVFGSYYKELYQSRYTPGNYEEDISGYKNDANYNNGSFHTRLIAIDSVGFRKLNESMGKSLDEDRFEAGEIAITCESLRIAPSEAVGKNVVFTVPDGKDSQKEYSVKIAHIGDNPAYFAGGYTPVLIVSRNYFSKLVETPLVESLSIDYTKPLSIETEQNIKDIFGNNNQISFESKLDGYHDMIHSEEQIKILGGGIAIILAVLSVLNYINMIAASVQNRLKEFATLESIGMTSKQIKKTLAKEGIGYALISMICATIIGLPMSYAIFQGLNKYGVDYALPIWADLLLYAISMIVCMIIPPCIYQSSQKGSVLERLKVNSD